MESPERKPIATDMETALFLVKHIDAPCGDDQGNNLRRFYVEEAKRELLRMKNPGAIQILEDTINKYNS